MEAATAFKEDMEVPEDLGVWPSGPLGFLQLARCSVLLRASWCSHRLKPRGVVLQGIRYHTAVRPPLFLRCVTLLEAPNGRRGVIGYEGAHGSISDRIQSRLCADWHTS